MALPKTKTKGDVFTVSQLTRRVKSTLEDRVGRVWVSGELSNFRVSPAGHSYFTLKDEHTQVSAVMFKGRLSRLKFEPKNGLEVILNGLVTVYEQRGTYQIICDDMQPKGVGALQLAFEKLREKLAEEGLFDEALKKPLPVLPRRIGIVTSPTGAAIRDMLNVIERRFAGVHILIWPARVQGDEAAREIVEGIRALDGLEVDVIIVGRGGGSLEDLWPFNEEAVVRAIHGATTPVISAVGHEIDFSLSDFAADVRAPTPSAAAELVVQEHGALVDRVRGLSRRLGRAMSVVVSDSRSRLDRAQSSFVFQRPEELTRELRQRCDELRMNLEDRMRATLEHDRVRLQSGARAISLLSPSGQLTRATERFHARRRRLESAGHSLTESEHSRVRTLRLRLEALNPLAILSRGYAVAWNEDDGALVRDAASLKHGDALRLRFGAGQAAVRVERVEP